MSPIHSIVAIAGVSLLTAAAAAQHDGHDHKEHAPTKAAAPHAAEVVPYMAGTCPISGQPLGSMGAPVVREYDGREVRFCCKSCIKKFEKAGKDGWKKLDAIMIEDQLPFYPVSTCLVSGEPLVEDGEDIAVDRIYNGRLVRFCCKSCVKDFMKNPEPTMAMLDAAVIAQQGKHYPLKTCVVSGEKLGSMGEPYELVVGNRLVRLCCDGCEKKLLANPIKYLKPLNAAWESQGMPAILTKVPVSKGHEMMDSPMKDKKKSGHDDHAGHDH